MGLENVTNVTITEFSRTDYLPNCKEGFYVDVEENECKPCTDNCSTCTKDHCIRCEEDFYLIKNKECEKTCPDGSVPVGNTCVKCSNDKCKTCDGKDTGTCTKCYDDQYI